MPTDVHEDLLVGVIKSSEHNTYGKYPGIVRDVDDPDKLGRIRAEVPAIYGEDEWSPWAWPCLPFAGNKHGMNFIPEVESLVWIECAGGNISIPIWCGMLWADDERPEPQDNEARAIVSTAGHKVILDDKVGEVSIEHAEGAKLSMKKTELAIELKAAKVSLTPNGISLTVNDVGMSIG
ncbi:MAG: phage baseplate assembly protein V [Verrucomicrobiota bacterium]